MMDSTEARLLRHLSSADHRLLCDVEAHFAASNYDEAARILLSRLESSLPTADASRRELIAAISGRLVDCGSYGQREGLIEKGLGLMVEHQDELRMHLGEALYHYNLATGKDGLYSLKLGRNQRYRLDSLDLLTQAKNHYWKAFRFLEASSASAQWPELMVNIGNTLRTAGRVAEALHWYEKALELSPNHPMAHANRSLCLSWLAGISCQRSIAMLAQVRDGYRHALQASNIPTQVREGWARREEAVSKLLEEHGYDEDEALHDQALTKKEVGEHSLYRNFCLSEGLVLSEHATYCRCIGARRDDLTIATTSGIISADLPKLEFVLNRLKAEFGLARSLYYQALTKGKDAWDVENYEQTYTELEDSEVTGLHAEMLRVSFRLCFGILDRVGFAICNQLDLASPKENIHFESFWRSRGLSTEERARRWKSLNENCTPSLVALYSQATDLNSASGEWGHFKLWRNKLEHEILILVQDGDRGLGPLIPKDDFVSIQVPYTKFARETLHMLRFTASAIFNYALWARQHALDKEPQDLGEIAPHELTKKPVGPE